jgi:hypothetical protein
MPLSRSNLPAPINTAYLRLDFALTSLEKRIDYLLTQRRVTHEASQSHNQIELIPISNVPPASITHTESVSIQPQTPEVMIDRNISLFQRVVNFFR